MNWQTLVYLLTIQTALLSFQIYVSAESFDAFLPNPKLTPGLADPHITPDNIHQTICRKGYTTKSVRPSSSYTNKLKIEQMKEYGLTGSPADFEEDHLIALTIGGNPTKPGNLWPQPRKGTWNAAKKDRLEVKAHQLVCSGKVQLRQMQQEMATDWITAYKKYVQQ